VARDLDRAWPAAAEGGTLVRNSERAPHADGNDECAGERCRFSPPMTSGGVLVIRVSGIARPAPIRQGDVPLAILEGRLPERLMSPMSNGL